jgi:autotransporter-associated beta strand protein
MGSTALAFAGGTLQLTGAQSLPNSLNINWATFSGGFDITNAATTFMVTNAISGAGSLVKSGSGTLVLTGSNTYSGATIISNGTLACYTNTLITPAVVTYLDQYTGRVAANLTNGVGMTPNNPVTSTSTCGYNSSDMWLSQQYSTNTWVTFDLGSEKSLSGFHLWNYNEPAALNRGVRVARIYTNSVGLASGSSYASAGPGWTGGGLVTTMNFAKAGGTSTEPGSDYMFNTMVSTRFIQIYVTTNWGDSAYTGLSEIRFYAGSPVAAIPTNTALTIASSGILDLFNGGLTVKDLTGAGTIANLGGTLTVTGTNTFTGNILGTGALNVSGVISPAGRNVFGTNTVTQALTFSGTLEVDVATDGTSDQLVTQGALNLTGATVSVVNELGLSLGKRYVILKYDTVTGDFSDILLPRLWMTKKDTVNKQILLLAKTGTMVRFF